MANGQSDCNYFKGIAPGCDSNNDALASILFLNQRLLTCHDNHTIM